MSFLAATALLVPAVALGTPLVAASAAGSSGSAFSKTETIDRTDVVNGQSQVVDKRTVSVHVDETAQLRNRQEDPVSWAGAHPTGGVVGDPTSSLASNEEYPVVVMQCRGVDSASAPASKRISPKTCWTETPDERFQYSTGTAYPPYRVDRYGTAGDHVLEAGAPSPYPAACSAFEGIAQHWVPFVAASGTVFNGGKQGCGGLPPESVSFGDSSVPNNTTYGVTDTQGKGTVPFVIQTADTNASLGCSATVPCSLVVVPVMGISCDTTNVPSDAQADASALCSRTGHYAAGERVPNGTGINLEDEAVGGVLWWSASNWRNRISVPLTFAPSASVCAIGNGGAPLYVYGSESLTQAMAQWQPHFCLDKSLFNIQHVQTGEPEAKNLLQEGSIDAAFEGQPPAAGYSRPVVHAPVALTGFAVVFKIDDANGQPVESLKLTPLLLAKLMTESYKGILGDDYPALAGNPSGIDVDPEFRALNPTVPKLSDTAAQYWFGADMILMLSSQSDLTYALTSYINADPAARAWLNGSPDKWGMTVNPNYKGISLPTSRWPLLDTFVPQSTFTAIGCPDIASPWLPLVASPVSTLANVTLDMQFDIASSQTNCVVSGDAQKMASLGRESTGLRFLLGVTSLADARRYKLPVSSLQTTSGGSSFAAPTDASLKSAASLMTLDKASGTWPIPYKKLQASEGADAYPGTLLISMDVPTKGLAKTDASRYATFLRFAAAAGQIPGSGSGQLPPGYLPMTSADDLGAEAAYTQKVAGTVQTQDGTYVAPSGSSSGSTSGSGGSTDGGTSGTSPSTGAGDGKTPATTGAPHSTTNTGTGATATLTSVRTVGAAAGLGGLALPLFLLVALLCGIAVPVTLVVARRLPS